MERLVRRLGNQLRRLRSVRQVVLVSIARSLVIRILGEALQVRPANELLLRRGKRCRSRSALKGIANLLGRAVADS